MASLAPRQALTHETHWTHCKRVLCVGQPGYPGGPCVQCVLCVRLLGRCCAREAHVIHVAAETVTACAEHARGPKAARPVLETAWEDTCLASVCSRFCDHRPAPKNGRRGRRSSPLFDTHVSETKRTLSTRDVERASTGGGAMLGPSRNHDARAPGSQLSCRHSPAAAHLPELQL